MENAGLNPNEFVPPEKVSADHSQLVLLLHAHQCHRKDNQANGEVRLCHLQHCYTTKKVLAHLTSCVAGQNCNVANCSSSKQIISHWKQCIRSDCPICQPLEVSNNHSNPNVVVPSQGVSADRSQANPEKRKMITQQLVLLLHAHQCQRRDNQANGEVRQCRLQHCNTMKGVLAHMTSCLAGRNCNVAHCSSSRQIISHWKQCTRPDCPICQPLKASNNRSALASNTTQNTTGINDINCYNNQVNQVPGVPNNVRTAMPSQMIHPPPNNNVLTPNQNTRVLAPHSQPQATTTMNTDPGTSSVNDMLQSVSNTTVQAPSSIQQPATNIPNSFIMTTSTDTMTTQMNNQVQPSQSMPGGTHIESKEWHESITSDLRNNLVHKLIKAIFPTFDPKAMLDKHMNNLVAYARKVEGDMYNVANSRSEYYHRLAQTFYEIQKELEEKMQKRKEQQQLGAQQQTNNLNTQCFPTVSTQGLPAPQQQQPLHHTSVQPNQQNLPQQVVTTSSLIKTKMSDRVHFPITSPVPATSQNYEFLSLRSDELHNQGQGKFIYTCNSCKSHVITMYHCTVCDDFDLCITCYEKEKHPHNMDKFNFDLDDGSSPGDQKQADPQEARKLSIRRCIWFLVHACQCRDANCRLASCQRMKRVVQHVKLSKIKSNGNCQICKQYIALCFHHAKYCTEGKCPVLFCLNMKHKIKEQQLQQRLQQAQLLRRRMALLRESMYKI